jgi:hypothetical protein
MTEPARIRFVGEARWSSFDLFNANAYPEKLHGLAETCGLRLALAVQQAGLVRQQQEDDLHHFMARLKEVEEAVKQNTSMTFVAEYDSIELYSSIFNVLSTVKAYLDVYAQLICRLIDPTPTHMTFQRKKSNGGDLSGGRLINWLRNRRRDKEVLTNQLADILEGHSTRWVTNAVHLRDELNHYAAEGEFVPMHTLLQHTDPVYTRETIRYAALSTGEPIADYCPRCVKNLNDLTKVTLRLLPNVGRSFLKLNDTGQA